MDRALPAEAPNQCGTEAPVPGWQQCAFRLEAVQQNRQGALTPRQRPNRHGRYHRAPSGFVSGTLSIPEVPQG
jgi:hypothetical protein